MTYKAMKCSECSNAAVTQCRCGLETYCQECLTWHYGPQEVECTSCATPEYPAEEEAWATDLSFNISEKTAHRHVKADKLTYNEVVEIVKALEKIYPRGYGFSVYEEDEHGITNNTKYLFFRNRKESFKPHHAIAILPYSVEPRKPK